MQGRSLGVADAFRSYPRRDLVIEHSNEETSGCDHIQVLSCVPKPVQICATGELLVRFHQNLCKGGDVLADPDALQCGATSHGAVLFQVAGINARPGAAAALRMPMVRTATC
jgi:hypothetical protein